MAENEIADKKEPTDTIEKKATQKKSVRKQGAETVAPPRSAALPPHVETNRGSGLSFAALGISLLALVAGGYAWYQTTVAAKLDAGIRMNRVDALEQRFGKVIVGNQEMMAQFNKLKQSLLRSQEELTANLAATRDETEKGEKVLRDLVREAREAMDLQVVAINAQQASRSEELRGEFAELAATTVKLREELDRSVGSWSLEEVKRLLLIANQQMQLAGDTRLALRALKLADERLQDLANPAYSEVRKQLATEISALQAIPTPDLVGLSNRLAALAADAGKIPLAGEANQEPPRAEGETADPSKEEADWLEYGRKLLGDIGGLVRIRKVGETRTLSPSPEFRYIVVENLRLILQGAQVALMKGDQALYANTMQSAWQWVVDHFDVDSPLTTVWLAQLEELTAEEIMVPRPDISGSLNALRKRTQSAGEGA